MEENRDAGCTSPMNSTSQTSFLILADLLLRERIDGKEKEEDGWMGGRMVKR